MKKSLFVMTAALALGCAAVAFSGVREAAVKTVRSVYAAWRWLVDVPVKLLRLKAHQRTAWRLPAVALAGARQYYLRQVERERPTTQARWRMAPSV